MSKRTKVIQVRCTPEELALLEAKAGNVPVSTWLRDVCIAHDPEEPARVRTNDGFEGGRVYTRGREKYPPGDGIVCDYSTSQFPDIADSAIRLRKLCESTVAATKYDGNCFRCGAEYKAGDTIAAYVEPKTSKWTCFCGDCKAIDKVAEQARIEEMAEKQ